MPIPACPKCRRMIPADDINVAKDVAYCRACNESYPLSDLTHGNTAYATVDLQRPPAGAWYRADAGGTIIGATNRSWAGAAGLLFFTLFWNGIVSFFVAAAIAGTAASLNIPLPTWFPHPKMSGGGMAGGFTVFMWLFLTPFIAIGLFMAAAFFNALLGRTEVKIENARATTFSGVGALGWKKTFEVAQVRAVQIYQRMDREGANTTSILIELRDGKQIKLGSMLTNERRQFVLGALQRTLLRA